VIRPRPPAAASASSADIVSTINAPGATNSHAESDPRRLLSQVPDSIPLIHTGVVGMLKVIYGAVIFVGIPGILLGLFIVNATVPGKAPNPESRVSGWAGFWAGLVLFAGYVVSVADDIRSPRFQLDTFPSVNIGALMLGLLVGYVLPFLLLAVRATRILGLLTLLTSSMTLVFLFSYLFHSDIRNFAMYLALSCLFGALLNVIFHPRVIRELYPTPSASGAGGR
jgi:hypothetical protein